MTRALWRGLPHTVPEHVRAMPCHAMLYHATGDADVPHDLGSAAGPDYDFQAEGRYFKFLLVGPMGGKMVRSRCGARCGHNNKLVASGRQDDAWARGRAMSPWECSRARPRASHGKLGR